MDSRASPPSASASDELAIAVPEPFPPERSSAQHQEIAAPRLGAQPLAGRAAEPLRSPESAAERAYSAARKPRKRFHPPQGGRLKMQSGLCWSFFAQNLLLHLCQRSTLETGFRVRGASRCARIGVPFVNANEFFLYLL